MAVVAAHERVAVRPPVCERRRGERVQPGRDRTAEQLLRPLRQRPRLVGRVDAAAGEAELARDGGNAAFAAAGFSIVASTATRTRLGQQITIEDLGITAEPSPESAWPITT